MEGVGARLGRSSTRYGPATVFTGPVRRWKKKWVHVSSSSAANRSQAHRNGGALSGLNGSHLKLYKWTPISQTGNGVGSEKDSGNDDDDDSGTVEEPPRRKFKYIPIAVLEEQKIEAAQNEAAEKAEEEAELNNNELSETEPPLKRDAMVEKPDMNDMPMEDNEAEDEDEDDNQLVRQDLNESTLDLSLGLNGDHGDPEST